MRSLAGVVMRWKSLSKLERAVEWRNPVRVDDKFDGASLAWDAPNEAALFQPNQHGIHGGRGEVEETLEVGVPGGYAGLTAHGVFADEREELPLLASRAAGERRSGWLPSGANGFEPGKGCADDLGSGFKR